MQINDLGEILNGFFGFRGGHLCLLYLVCLKIWSLLSYFSTTGRCASRVTLPLPYTVEAEAEDGGLKGGSLILSPLSSCTSQVCSWRKTFFLLISAQDTGRGRGPHCVNNRKHLSPPLHLTPVLKKYCHEVFPVRITHSVLLNSFYIN